MTIIRTTGVNEDVSFVWDAGFRCFVLRSCSDLGELWFKRIYGIKTSVGKLVALPLFPEVYDSALNCGLTVSVIDK